MKDDYLWDKTGEDAEIQALENALKAFRYQDNAPPALPQKVFTVETSGWRNVFRFGIPAFAAFASLLIVFSLVWFQTGGASVRVSEIVRQANELQSAENMANNTFTAPPVPPADEPVESAPTDDKPTAVKVRQRRAPVVRPQKAIWRKPKSKEPSETLTAEERYAYNQLMLALSITGAQLKIVKDKVQGIEDRNAVVDTEK